MFQSGSDLQNEEEGDRVSEANEEEATLEDWSREAKNERWHEREEKRSSKEA